MTEVATTAPKQSRLGKLPVVIAKGVTMKIENHTLTVKGPKGELTRTFRDEITLVEAAGSIVVGIAEGAGSVGAQYQGLTRSLVDGMVKGVAEGFTRSLDFRGVGYRAEFNKGELKMTCGLSHQPIVKIPGNVRVNVETIDQAGTKFPRVHLESADKELVGRLAAQIRSKRPPEPYNGKGVRYTGETVREKAGKAGKAG